MPDPEALSYAQEFRSKLGAEARSITLASTNPELVKDGLVSPTLNFQRIDLNPVSQMKPGFVLEYDTEHNIYLLTGDRTGKNKLDADALVDRMGIIQRQITNMYEKGDPESNVQLPKAIILVDIYDSVSGLPDAIGIIGQASRIQGVLPDLNHIHGMYESTASETMSAINNSVFGALKKLTEGSQLLLTRKHTSANEGIKWILEQGFVASSKAKFKHIKDAPEGIYSPDQRKIAESVLKEILPSPYYDSKIILLLNQAWGQLQVAG